MLFILRVLVCAVALWLTTLIVHGPEGRGVWVQSYQDSTAATVLTYLLIAAIFGIINATLGRVVRFISFPLYVITLGLFALVVNTALLFLVAWLSELMGFGLRVGGFWSGVLGALVLAVLTALISAITGAGRKRRR